jgi:hypothetical protein
MAAKQNSANVNDSTNILSQIIEQINLLEAEQQQQHLQQQPQIIEASSNPKAKKPRHRKTKSQKNDSDLSQLNNKNVITGPTKNNSCYNVQQNVQHHHNYHHNQHHRSHHHNNQHQHPLHHRAHHHNHHPHPHPIYQSTQPYQQNDTALNINKSNKRNHINSDQAQSQKKAIYERYYEPIKVHEGILNNEIIQGKLRINPRSFEDAFITDPVQIIILIPIYSHKIIDFQIIFVYLNRMEEPTYTLRD